MSSFISWKPSGNDYKTTNNWNEHGIRQSRPPTLRHTGGSRLDTFGTGWWILSTVSWLKRKLGVRLGFNKSTLKNQKEEDGEASFYQMFEALTFHFKDNQSVSSSQQSLHTHFTGSCSVASKLLISVVNGLAFSGNQQLGFQLGNGRLRSSSARINMNH